MNAKPFTFEEFKAIYSKVPRVSVDLVIETPKGIVLTLRNLSSWNNQWHLPGVTVLYNERVEEAVQRAAQSEAGVEVEIVKMLGYLEYPSEQQERGFGSTVSLGFLCKIKNGALKPNEDATEIGEFPIAQLPENMVAEQKDFLKNTSWS